MVRLLLGTWLVITANSVQACELYYLGVIPQSPLKQVRQTWTPIIELLNSQLLCPIYLKLANDPAEFAQAIRDDQYGLIYVDSVYLKLAQTATAYTLLTGTYGSGMDGILLVHQGNPVQQIGDLDQPVIEFAATTSFAASKLIQAELKRKKVLYTEQYLVSQEQVYLNLARKVSQVGAGSASSLAKSPPEIRRQLRVIWRFPDAGNHYIAAHPKMDANYRSQLLQVLLSLNKTPKGKLALSKLHSKGFYTLVDLDSQSNRSLTSTNADTVANPTSR